jgi:ABC-type nickel/cobalt efflux system permease component RcnA
VITGHSVSSIAHSFRLAVRWAAIGLLALLSGALPCRAHPADEALVYHYLWLEAKPGQVSLQHASVVGGLLGQAVWSHLDPDGDRQLTQQEQERHARELASGLSLKIDGRPVRWKLDAYEYPSHEQFFGGSFPAIKLLLSAPLPKVPHAGLALAIRDDTYIHFKGAFPQPVIRPTRLAAGEPLISEDGRVTGVRLEPLSPAAAGPSQPSHASTPGSNAPTLRRSNEPSRLPGLSLSPDAGGNAPAERETRPRLEDRNLGNAPIFPDRGQVVYSAPPGDRHGSETGPLKGFLGKPLSAGLIFFGLGVALLAGAAHALSPGHGKAMVGAYLVGSRGTVWDAVLLGIVVTITHTAGVYILGFLCLWLTTRIQAEVVGHWLSLISGVLVLALGFWLFQRGLLAYHGIRPLPGHAHDGHTHGHSHVDHSHSHEHRHSHAHAHVHESVGEEAVVSGQWSVVSEGDQGEAGFSNSQSLHPSKTPPHDSPLEEYEPRKDDRAASGSNMPWMRAERPRSDEPSTLNRLPPERGAQRSKPAWGVIALGIAGGMVPCFDALAILIAAVNLGSIQMGLALIAAFSVGMGAVLIGIGILMVKAKDLMMRFTGESRWVRALPAASGAVLFFLGTWLTLQALVEAGIVRLG